MVISLLIISFLLSISDVHAENENDNNLQFVLSELDKLKQQVREDRMEYETALAKHEARIAELELRLSISEKQNSMHLTTITEGNSDDVVIPPYRRRSTRQLIGTPGIAFTAYLSKHSSNLGHQHTIPFDSVILNEGQAFNTNTHEFTCPVSGVYTFQTALLSQENTLSITEIVKEGVQLVQAHAEARSAGTGYDQGFNSVVTKCNKGEDVWVRNYQHYGSTVYSARYTTFTGFLLWETEDPAIVG